MNVLHLTNINCTRAVNYNLKMNLSMTKVLSVLKSELFLVTEHRKPLNPVGFIMKIERHPLLQA